MHLIFATFNSPYCLTLKRAFQKSSFTLFFQTKKAQKRSNKSIITKLLSIVREPPLLFYCQQHFREEEVDSCATHPRCRRTVRAHGWRREDEPTTHPHQEVDERRRLQEFDSEVCRLHQEKTYGHDPLILTRADGSRNKHRS